MMTYDSANLAKMKDMRNLAPDGMAAFYAFNEAVFQEGALSIKVKELIALAVAITTQCVYCIDVHTTKSKAAGATDVEITEATLIAAAINAGGAITHGTHALS